MIKRTIAFSPPDITEAEIEEVGKVLRSGWITTGPKTKEFEKRIAKYSSILSPIVAILHISEGKRNTRTLLSNGGN